MFEATASEFPFIGELPKREKSKVAKALDLVREFSELTDKHGCLIALPLLHGVLNVSRSRVYQLVKSGDLPVVKFGGIYFVPEKELVEFCKLERKTGTSDFKGVTMRTAWRASVKAVFASKEV